MGWSTALHYPVNFVLLALRPLIPVITFFFVAKLVTSGPSVGGDYYSFVIIGLLTSEALAGALGGFTFEMQSMVQQGQFEMLLIEPVRWRLIPFGLAAWPVVMRSVLAFVSGAIAVFLGADFSSSEVLSAIALFMLGLSASLVIGVFSGAIGVLSKRSDPVLTLYTLVVGILSGVAFPIELLPRPARTISLLIPHTYVITGMRKLLLPGGDSIPGPSLIQAVLVLTGFIVVGYPLVLWAFGRTMEAGRRSGVLSGY